MISVQNLTINYLKDPCGLDTLPRFSYRTRQNGEDILTQIAATQKFGENAQGRSYIPTPLCPHTDRALSENDPAELVSPY